MELLSSTIQIKEVGIEDRRLKIISEEGLVYSIWKTKKDGTETQAYATFKNVALSAQGMFVDISYDELPNPQNAGTFFRNIKIISRSQQTQAIQPQQPQQTQQYKPTNNDLENKVKNLELRVSILEGKSFQNAQPTQPQQPTNNIQNIANTLGGEVVTQQPQQLQTITQQFENNNQEIRLEDIPF